MLNIYHIKNRMNDAARRRVATGLERPRLRDSLGAAGPGPPAGGAGPLVFFFHDSELGPRKPVAAPDGRSYDPVFHQFTARIRPGPARWTSASAAWTRSHPTIGDRLQPTEARRRHRSSPPHGAGGPAGASPFTIYSVSPN